jgi:hypothetical protein
MALPLVTDPIDWALDPVTGDLPATGSIAYTTGLPAVVQGAKIRLRMFAGEWFLNLAQGMPWLQRLDGSVTAAQAILGQKFDRLKTLQALRDQLLGNAAKNISGVPGILSLVSLDCTFDNISRTLTITWQARTAFGDTNLNTLAVGGSS